MFAAGSRRANWDDNDEKNCLAMRNTMRAIVVADKNRAGVGTVETPTPGADEIRVRVKAAALNRADLLVLAGHQHGSVGGAGAILGLECVGEVESLGQGVTGFAIGDRVMCSARHAMAEYVVTDAGRATKIPSGMSFEEATTLPVALQTMHDALMTNGRLKKGESVLVQGASSGVGLMALKIAKLMGAGLVIGTSTNEARRARLKEFGADLALDFAFDGLGRGGAESDRRQGRRSHHRPDFWPRRERQHAGGQRARPYRQCRPTRRHEGRV